MSNVNKYIQGARSLSGNLSGRSNTPRQYRGGLKPYLDYESNKFIEQYAQYSSDFFEVEVQGLNPNDFYEWTTTRARLCDTGTPTATSTRIMDDYKMVLFEKAHFAYFPAGAKLKAMGSTWISTNPRNISSPNGTGIIQRCNSVWNHLDFYGNILHEPICLLKSAEAANDTDEQRLALITKGYMDVLCQYNDQTRQLNQNSRLILGSAAFSITGYTDYIQEFTGDYSSVHLLRFTVRYMEPNETDDMENHVAGGKTFNWDIRISGTPAITVGKESTLKAESYRCGELVESTDENPVSYIWKSSDKSIAAVSSSGTVTAIGVGTCEITATLAQNREYQSSFTVQVTEASTEPEVKFTIEPPKAISAYHSATLTAAYFENGEQTGTEVEWLFDGANESTYSVETSGNSATITCYGGPVDNLIVTASANGVSTSTEIELIGV